MDVPGIGVTVGRGLVIFIHHFQHHVIRAFIFVVILVAAVFYMQAAHEFSLGGRAYLS